VLVISIVSHGQGNLVANLLRDLDPLLRPSVKVIVTLNIPESEAFEVGPHVTLIRNEQPMGFGANHNQAFRSSRCDYFAVLNPDVRLDWRVFATILESLRSGVGVCAPQIRSPAGHVEDSARTFPTWIDIAHRLLVRLQGKPLCSSYEVAGQGLIEVDWVAGMFMVFAANAYANVGGFDERYFMYLEDADICYRLWRAGWKVSMTRDVYVTHDARRATFKSAQHLRWHVSSLFRFLLSHSRDPKR
jgi:N-acetylglucosaminyl-diphospho-decaprenol L-rhamnosyltransferase